MPDPEFPDRLSRDEATPPLRPRRGRGMIVGGVAGALALGALGGLIMRPQLDAGSDHQQPVRDVELPNRPDDLISLLPPLRPPPPPEFDPDEEFELEEEPLPEPEGPEPPPEPEPEEEEPEPRRFDRVQPQQPQPRPRPQPAPPPARVTVNCSGASSTADRLVCVDPRLRSLDQQMAAAYGAALASGVPPAVLSRQQQAWLRARDAAAAHGPEDLAGVYHARIAELRGMAR